MIRSALMRQIELERVGTGHKNPLMTSNWMVSEMAIIRQWAGNRRPADHRLTKMLGSIGAERIG